MTPKTRLANKTQWALQDIAADCKAIRRDWAKAIAMAERNLDPAMMAVLARMAERLGAIETKAVRALHGEYEQEG